MTHAGKKIGFGKVGFVGHCRGVFQLDVLCQQKIRQPFQCKVVFHPRQNNGWADRLGDVINGPKFQALFLILNLALRREENHGDVHGPWISFESLTNLIAIHSRHHDIEQNQIWSHICLGDLERPFSTVGNLDSVIILEQTAHQHQVVRCIIHHQNRGLGNEIRLIHQSSLQAFAWVARPSAT